MQAMMIIINHQLENIDNEKFKSISILNKDMLVSAVSINKRDWLIKKYNISKKEFELGPIQDRE